ncbi:hypothetical protein GE061_001384 [Apolygus lucorum]|uniref:MD-2-related lipid-recognition domain-containing protein n=1 Tax=Apolygus lucorum TaxID=248454 RepID=A0A6A4IK81_APOLU|nr:hypothetical protein GE061_001384 [Apolygus lucorum]
MYKLASLAFYCHFCLAFIGAAPKGHETSIIREFGPCDGLRKTPFHLERITANVTGRGATTFNGNIDVDEDLDHISNMEIKVDKCSSYSDLGSCEYYSSYKFTDPCETIMCLTEGPWAAIFHTKPPLTCPVKKGSYGLHQSSVKPSYLALPNMSGNVYWKFSMKLLIGKRVVACVKGGIEKAVIRSKSKT